MRLVFLARFRWTQSLELASSIGPFGKEDIGYRSSFWLQTNDVRRNNAKVS